MRIQHLVCVLIIWFLAACSKPAEPSPSPLVPTAPPATPITALQAGPVRTIGYLLVDTASCRLAEAVSLAGAQPQALGQQLACSIPEANASSGVLLEQGSLRQAIVLAEGQLQNTAGSAPLLTATHYTVLVPEETSVASLLEQSSQYRGRVVRVNGSLVVDSQGGAILVDRLSSGGIPLPGARQVKVPGAARDTVLLQQLVEAGTVRYGSVQVEGLWRDGVLHPLVVRLLRGA